MPFVLRKTKDEALPKLPDVYGTQQTAGRLVYWKYEGNRTYFIVLFCRGGKYGCDGLNFFRYKGVAVPEFQAGFEGNEAYRNWRFHPGTLTKQIVLKTVTVDAATDTFTSNAHGYANGNEVRIRSFGGVVPAGLVANSKYFIVGAAANTFQLSLTSGGAAIDITDAGSGTVKVWKADAGFDDPVQGRPQFFPSLDLTFSNMCYIEGMIPTDLSENAEPTAFQFGFRGRKIADFNNVGTVIATNHSANNARVFADILLNELKRPLTRNDWASWFTFKQACDVLIWDRSAANTGAAGTGLTGRYYNHPSSDPNGGFQNILFENATLVLTRTDAEINFNWGTGSPGAGVNADWFLARWEGLIKPQYTETHTFYVTVNEAAKVWINNELIINHWYPVGATSGQIALTANTPVNIKVEFAEGTGAADMKLEWQSASQARQVVPQSRLYPSDAQVKRYEAHVVFPSATQAGEAINEVMKRAPGWHIQDVNGKIKFLAPDRTVVHTFLYDPAAQNQKWNIAAKTFEAKPRRSDERPNFRVHFFNDLGGELLEEKWVEGDRPNLRDRQGGLPSDVSPARWGVMTRSLAKRIAEMEMKLFSDSDREFTLRGQVDSYHVAEGDRVLLAHVSTGETYALPIEAIVASEGFGAGQGDEKSYTFLPVTFPLVTDEPVV